MANRFNQLRQDNYVSSNTYVPMPLEAIAGIAKDYSDTYKANIKDLDETNDLYSKVNAIDKHQGYKKALVDEFTKRTDELAERFASGQDMFKAERDLHKLKRDWTNNSTRQELETSYLNYGAYQKDKIAKGDKYGEWYDNYLPFKGQRDDGSIEGYRYTGMGEVQDHQKLAGEMMAKIGEDGSLTDYEIRDPKTNDVLGYKKGAEYILRDKVANLANGKADSFLLTKEGKDFAKMINYHNPNVNVRDAAVEYLTQAGMNQVHGKITMGNSIKDASEYRYKLLNQENNIPLPQTIEGAEIMNFTNPKYGDLMKKGIIKKGGVIDWSNIESLAAPSITGVQSAGPMGGSGSSSMEFKRDKKESDKILKDIYEIVNQAVNTIGKDNIAQIIGKPYDQMKASDYNKVLGAYNEISKVRGYNGNQLSGAERLATQEDVVDHPSNYEVLDGNLQLSTNDVEDFKKGVYNSKDYTFNVENRVNISGKSYLMASVTNKESGETKTAFLRPKIKEYNQNFDDVAKVSQDIAKGYASNKPLPKAKDPRVPTDSKILSETVTDGGQSLTVVYDTPTGEQLVMKYDYVNKPTDTKGKYEKVLSGGELLGSSFKEYQQIKHLSFARRTAEGGNMYQNSMSQQKSTEDQLGR